MSLIHLKDSNGHFHVATSNTAGVLLAHDSVSKGVLDDIKTAVEGTLSVSFAIAQTPVAASAQGNAWNAVTVSDGGNSAAIDCNASELISVAGDHSNTTDAHNIIVQVSGDGTNYYNAYHLEVDGDGNFHHSFRSAFRYVRLQATKGGTLTALIVHKH